MVASLMHKANVTLAFVPCNLPVRVVHVEQPIACRRSPRLGHVAIKDDLFRLCSSKRVRREQRKGQGGITIENKRRGEEAYRQCRVL